MPVKRHSKGAGKGNDGKGMGGRFAPSEAPEPVTTGLAPSLHNAFQTWTDSPREKLGGPEHYARLFDGGPMGTLRPMVSNKELTRRDARTLASGGTLYVKGPKGEASIVEDAESGFVRFERSGVSIVERAYPANMDSYDQDRLDTICAARNLERTGKHFKASDIAKYVYKRRRVLFGRSLARRPVDNAVAAAALEQTRREDEIAEWGNNSMGTDRPWADNDPSDIFKH